MLTSGYDPTKVIPALRRHGWQNPTKQGYSVVSGDNQVSKSGRFYNDGSFHTLVTIQNIRENQEDEHITTDQLNTLLARLGDSAILRALALVYTDTTTLETNTLSVQPNEHYSQHLIENNGKFVGRRLRVSKVPIQVSFADISLLFNADAIVHLKLYHSHKSEPIWDKEVAVTANVVTVVPVTDINVQISGLDYSSNGYYYLGYGQSAIGGAKAIDFSTGTYCLNYVGATGFECTGTPMAYSTLTNTGNRSYGINATIIVSKDITSQIVNNAHIFDELIGMQMAALVLELIQNSTRSNRTERINAEKAQAAIALDNVMTSENPITTGIRGRLTKEAKVIRDKLSPKQGITVVSP